MLFWLITVEFVVVVVVHARLDKYEGKDNAGNEEAVVPGDVVIRDSICGV